MDHAGSQPADGSEFPARDATIGFHTSGDVLANRDHVGDFFAISAHMGILLIANVALLHRSNGLLLDPLISPVSKTWANSPPTTRAFVALAH